MKNTGKATNHLRESLTIYGVLGSWFKAEIRTEQQLATSLIRSTYIHWALGQETIKDTLNSKPYTNGGGLLFSFHSLGAPQLRIVFRVDEGVPPMGSSPHWGSLKRAVHKVLYYFWGT